MGIERDEPLPRRRRRRVVEVEAGHLGKELEHRGDPQQRALAVGAGGSDDPDLAPDLQSLIFAGAREDLLTVGEERCGFLHFEQPCGRPRRRCLPARALRLDERGVRGRGRLTRGPATDRPGADRQSAQQHHRSRSDQRSAARAHGERWLAHGLDARRCGRDEEQRRSRDGLGVLQRR